MINRKVDGIIAINSDPGSASHGGTLENCFYRSGKLSMVSG